MKSLEMYLKVKYCEVNKNSNLHNIIAVGTYNPRKLPKSSQYIQKQPLLRYSNTVEIW
jgi:hypothetical protein